MRRLIAPIILVLLSSCATPEKRLETGLREAGLSQRQSNCMADRMAGKLSIGQLLKIRSLGNLREERIADVGMKRFLRNVRALDDPEIVAITTSAALGCALAS